MSGARAALRLAACCLLGAAAAGAAQTPPPGVDVEELDAAPRERVAETFERAEALFRSADQRESIPLYGEVIDLLGRGARAPDAAPEIRRLLALSLFRRAEARFNLGEEEATRADLARLLTLDPGFAPPETVSPKLAELLEEGRGELVGELLVDLFPADAELRVDGRPAAAGEPLPLAAGPHRLLARRPGFAAVEREVEVAAGRRREVALAMERRGPALRLRVEPSPARVFVDGAPATTLEGSAVGEPSDAELLVGGFPPGVRRVVIRQAGFRDVALRLPLTAAADYVLAPVELEPARGHLRLSALPSAARVEIDGLEHTAGGPWKLLPGEHRLRVTDGRGGEMRRTFRLADGELLELEVELRPTLALLGVLGEDEVRRRELERRLGELVAGSELLLPAEPARPGAAATPPAAGAFRLAAGAGPAPTTEPGAPPPHSLPADWTGLRRRLARHGPASLYLLAVLAPGSYARWVDLWLFTAPSGPVLPHLSRIDDPADPDALAAWFGRLTASPDVTRVDWSLDLLDAPSAEAPLVLAVGSAARAAGLEVGDRLLAVDGLPVADARSARDALEEAEARGRATVEVDGWSGRRPAQLRAERVARRPDPRRRVLPPPAAWASLEPESGWAPPLPAWAAELRRAALLVAGGAPAEAARRLEELEAAAEADRAPPSARAAVAYWRGRALAATGDAAAARRAFTRAAELADAAPVTGTPRLAPRARARADDRGDDRADARK